MTGRVLRVNLIKVGLKCPSDHWLVRLSVHKRFLWFQ